MHNLFDTPNETLVFSIQFKVYIRMRLNNVFRLIFIINDLYKYMKNQSHKTNNDISVFVYQCIANIVLQSFR